MKYKDNYNILQVYLNNFELNTLYEKYPIVIYDQIYDINELLTTAFKFSFVFKTAFTINSDFIYRNSHKFLLLSSNDDDIFIKLINPKYKKDIKNTFDESNIQYITIKLKPKQILIVPALWHYYTNNIDVSAIGLDDCISKWLYKLV
jgi:hypothetical protein